MKEKLKLIGLIIIAILLIAVIVIVLKAAKNATGETNHPVATFEIQDYGTVKMELYPEYAPNTVSNFIALIQAGFYNNKIIYGKDSLALYMGRNSDEEATGATISLIDESIEAGSDEDYEYEINGEFVANGFEQNTLRHEKGIVSLNRSDYSSYGLTDESYNSGNYRFSVMMGESSSLNGVYCAFGKITEGLDILQNIYDNTAITTNEDSEENEDAIQEFETKPVITTATVETYNVDYGKPEVHEAFDIQSYINDLYSQYISY